MRTTLLAARRAGARAIAHPMVFVGIVIAGTTGSLASAQPALSEADTARLAELKSALDTHMNNDDFSAGIALAEQILAIREAAQGASWWETTDARLEVATLRRLAELTPQEREELGTAQSESRRVASLYREGRYTEAEELARTQIPILTRFLGSAHRKTLVVRANLAAALWGRGLAAEGAQVMRAMLSECVTALGEDHLYTITARNNFAAMLHARSQLAEAAAIFRATANAGVRVLGRDHPQVLNTLGNLALVERERGDLRGAELLQRSMLDGYRRTLGAEHQNALLFAGNLALLYREMGRLDDAEALLHTVTNAQSRTLRAGHPERLLMLANLANVQIDQGRLEEAEALLTQVLAARIEEQGERHPGTLSTVSSLAVVMSKRGQHALAEAKLRAALAAQSETLGVDNSETILTQASLADTLRKQGLFEEAVELAHRTYSTYLRTLGDSHPRTVAAARLLANCHYDRGNLERAEFVLASAAQSFEAARRRCGQDGFERGLFDAGRSPWAFRAGLAARRGAAREAWRYLEASFARGLLDAVHSRAHERLSEDERGARRARLQQLAKLDEELSVLATAAAKDLSSVASDRSAAKRAERESLLSAHLTAEAAFDGGAALPSTSIAELERVQAALAPEAAVIAWIDFEGNPQSSSTQSGEHWALVLRREGEPRCIALPGTSPTGDWRAEDDRLPTEVLELLQTRPVAQGAAPLDADSAADPTRGVVVPTRDLAARRAERIAELCAQLQRQRLAPLAAALDKTETLPRATQWIVLPAGVMSGVPIEALASSRSSHTIRYAPSASLATVLAEQKRAEQPQRAPRILAVGGAEDVGSELAAIERESLRPLPFAAWELATLAALFGNPPNESSAPLATAPVQVLIGAAASEPSLVALATSDELAGFDYLHFATHAEIDHLRPLRSALLLARGRGVAGSDGFALALDGGPVYDGRLTAERVARTWRLDAELVTLSACQSALGKSAGGEGFLGFSQALFAAGARNLLVSLWRVDDRATALLMARFYFELKVQRMSLAAALADAKAWLRTLSESEARELTERGSDSAVQSTNAILGRAAASSDSRAGGAAIYADPYYWAGFVLFGGS